MSRPAKGNRSLSRLLDDEHVYGSNSIPAVNHGSDTTERYPEIEREALLYAIKEQNVTAVTYLAEIIHTSCFYGTLGWCTDLPRLDALLSSGKIDPNVRDPMGNRPIDAACARGDSPILQRLYAVTTASDIQDGSGNTLMHLATKGSHYAMVEFLIKERADINTANEACSIPLQLATNSEVRRLLVDNSAKMHPVDHSDRLMRDAIHTML
ncbi:unnamed protein product [Fusarium venenatum]|uniref:Uncharacterized protein n=1 Tax=Fusarium venenatum TaxID=56646 RepID=A0A2L2TZ27_9HYPO|nr:uncharacterized protein FVRRES_04072 [Fusarium venenatum]CEI67560.1 unnamed protein product [Fusarium venenatum]